jgi:CheY-like chemotaxis protein
MRILFLDDDPTRIQKFKQAMIGHEVIAVETADDAIARLRAESFDAVSLDHDLGGEVYVASEEHNTGYSVAKEMVTIENRPTTIIHSYNPVGAKRMADKLNAPHIPFATPRYWKSFGLTEMPDYTVAIL